MRTVRRFLLLAAFIACVPAAYADELASLGEAFNDEVRSFDVDIREYGKLRAHETERIAALAALESSIDRMLGDPSISLGRLQSVEREIEATRQEVDEASRAAADARAVMYARMKRIDALLGAIESEGVEIVAPGDGLTGTWSLSVPEYDVKGVMSLRQRGATVSGSFRMSTGARGSLDGSFADGTLTLRMIDAVDGSLGTSRASVDAESGALVGDWQPLAIRPGEPSLVSWTARRLSMDDLLDP